MKNLRTMCLVLSMFLCQVFYAQKYVPAENLTLVGKAMPSPELFHRVDTSKYNDMPYAVKKLFTNSSGMAICFKTNSHAISAKWSVARKKLHNNMTPISQKGLDLYIKRGGQWIFAGVAGPVYDEVSFKTTIVANMADGEKECILYLPLYEELKTLEIGVDDGAEIEALKNPFPKKIVVYGSSILQGASASRPGLAYTSRLGRETGLEFINLGLSGAGKMEKEVVDMVADIKADAYILDCMYNPTATQIRDRTAYMVNTLRDRYPGKPIIVIQRTITEDSNFDREKRAEVMEQHKAVEEQVKSLFDKGIKDFYYIPENRFLGTNHEGTIDGDHPNDMGFDCFLSVVKPQIVKILAKYNIK